MSKRLFRVIQFGIAAFFIIIFGRVALSQTVTPEEFGHISYVAENLLKHYPADQFIPSSILSTGKKIVLLDYSSLGSTLVSVDHYLGKYLKKKGLKSGIQLVAMSNSDQAGKVLANFYDNKIKNGKVIIVEDGLSHTPSEKFSFNLRNQQYDDVAPYMSYSPHLKKEKQVLRKNPKYQKFKNELSNWIKKNKMFAAKEYFPMPKRPWIKFYHV